MEQFDVEPVGEYAGIDVVDSDDDAKERLQDDNCQEERNLVE